jgi:galactokinase
MNLLQRVQNTFRASYGTEARYVTRAPGRVNLIGEHTDYNDGFVLPLAIDRAIHIALRPRADRRVVIRSLDMEATETFSLDHLERNQATWVEYVKGMAWALQESGLQLAGWEGVMAGDVPMGAGLSSSAALEMAAARAFLAVSGAAWDGAAMARLGQRTENMWMDVQSGIMDQMISAVAVAGHALLIDCRTLATEPVPLPPGSAVVILDTGTRRGLVDSAYNERRAQCESAARFFGVRALRDVTPAALAAREAALDPVVLRRARHVVAENARVLSARAAMRAGDAVALGSLMNASHASLRDDFEVSSQALDAIVSCAQEHPACYGARMTGAGFGGCAVALVEAGAASRFVAAVGTCYRARTANEAAAYVTGASAGATLLVQGR